MRSPTGEKTQPEGWDKRVKNGALPSRQGKADTRHWWPARLCRAGTRRSGRSTARHGTAAEPNGGAALTKCNERLGGA